jgi:hypothetical protein
LIAAANPCLPESLVAELHEDEQRQLNDELQGHRLGIGHVIGGGYPPLKVSNKEFGGRYAPSLYEVMPEAFQYCKELGRVKTKSVLDDPRNRQAYDSYKKTRRRDRAKA